MSMYQYLNVSMTNVNVMPFWSNSLSKCQYSIFNVRMSINGRIYSMSWPIPSFYSIQQSIESKCYYSMCQYSPIQVKLFIQIQWYKWNTMSLHYSDKCLYSIQKPIMSIFNKCVSYSNVYWSVWYSVSEAIQLNKCVSNVLFYSILSVIGYK